MNIYVGNLSLEVTEEEIRREFSVFGEILSIRMMNDKYIGSGQLKGYGFIEMASQKDAEIAVNNLNGKRLWDREIEVIRALPLTDKRKEVALNGKMVGSFSTKVKRGR